MASLDLSLAFDVVKNFNDRNSCLVINDLSNINSYRHVLKTLSGVLNCLVNFEILKKCKFCSKIVVYHTFKVIFTPLEYVLTMAKRPHF